MHVFLVSACQHKAWSRSRAVLDSYAIRAGERTWVTPITQEELEELKLLLRRKATRQTAVACYSNDGLRRMRLLWIVGSRDAFGPDGHYPVEFTRSLLTPLPTWLRDVSLLAQVGGYLHDWGKSGAPFAGMLSAALQGQRSDEPVRHEWVSLCLFREAMSQGFAQAWNGASSEAVVCNPGSLKRGICTKLSAAQFLIATHHRLLGASAPDKSNADSSGHVTGKIPVGGIQPAGSIDLTIWKRAEHLVLRLGKVSEANEAQGADYWRPVALLARAALILADHQVSSIDYQATVKPDLQQDDARLFANTKKDAITGRMRYDQPLDWHLSNVAEKAASLAYRMVSTRFEALSEATVESILEPSDDQRFAWQDTAVRFIKRVRAQSSAPALIFNIAGTGAGKTRANAKIVCALSDRPRFSVALNLRSLTLQTGDSMKRDFGLYADELGVVIGDRVIEKLHQHSQDAFSVSEDTDDIEFSAIAKPMELPDWLQPFDRDGKVACLLPPPVLVSTIDFIINAGEPGRQGHHALALLRLMSSDLVLDELDSYDSPALPAVLRLIQTAAMLGRNVVCSTATLSWPVACAVYEAFLSGLRMHVTLEKTKESPFVVLMDDLLAPAKITLETLGYDTTERVKEVIIGRQQAIMAALNDKPVYRMPICINIPERSPSAFFAATIDAARRFHQDHQWPAGGGKQLSFGLIRVANIKTAISLARHLAQAWPEARVACYHANELRIQRHLKETRLDFLLTRKNPEGKHILSDPEIRAALERASSVPFIVVATPVEEIGRDHDFDWAVIEPSSVHSIVQVSGRVNRHRLIPVSKPNVGLLNFNMRAAQGSHRGDCFLKPGLETRHKHKYSATDMDQLFNWYGMDRIDASLRFGDHLMARDEDKLTENQLKNALEVLRGDSGEEAMWMCRGHYSKYPLRTFVEKRRYRLEPDHALPRAPFRLKMFDPGSVKKWPYKPEWKDRKFKPVERIQNDWLVWDDRELVAAAEDAGIEAKEAMSVEIAVYNLNDQYEVSRDESFGFSLEKV
ncbi:hypothetical protein [Pseudomonas frederiksbergensis]|uniref:hypothetical protein n=1 Tax=Pseudomonas frederiksbergensis TaxID=104087 RepID=UPI003D1AB5C5